MAAKSNVTLPLCPVCGGDAEEWNSFGYNFCGCGTYDCPVIAGIGLTKHEARQHWIERVEAIKANGGGK